QLGAVAFLLQHDSDGVTQAVVVVDDQNGLHCRPHLYNGLYQMLRSLFVLIMAAAPAFSQYKLQPAGPPPSELPPAVAATLQKDGSKVVAGNGSTWCEIWFRTTAPSGPKSAEDGASLP